MQLESYYYHGSAEFKMYPFSTDTPSECVISYTCRMIRGPNDIDLCSFTDTQTVAEFDRSTGDYTFQSYDFPTFGTQTITLEITGRTGETDLVKP